MLRGFVVLIPGPKTLQKITHPAKDRGGFVNRLLPPQAWALEPPQATRLWARVILLKKRVIDHLSSLESLLARPHVLPVTHSQSKEQSISVNHLGTRFVPSCAAPCRRVATRPAPSRPLSFRPVPSRPLPCRVVRFLRMNQLTSRASEIRLH